MFIPEKYYKSYVAAHTPENILSHKW